MISWTTVSTVTRALRCNNEAFLYDGIYDSKATIRIYNSTHKNRTCEKYLQKIAFHFLSHSCYMIDPWPLSITLMSKQVVFGSPTRFRLSRYQYLANKALKNADPFNSENFASEALGSENISENVDIPQNSEKLKKNRIYLCNCKRLATTSDSIYNTYHSWNLVNCKQAND